MTTTTVYTWNPLTDSVIEESDGSGNVLCTYTNEPSQFGPLNSENRGGATSYYHVDAVGSTRLTSNSNQAVVDEFVYDAWGNIVVSTGTSGTPYQWCGGLGFQTDSTVAGAYARARTYLPVLARWSSVDPLDITGFTGTSYEPYLYAGNSPINAVDPSGMANLWNPLTWGISYPGQGWIGFINPISEESVAAIGGFGLGYYQGSAYVDAWLFPGSQYYQGIANRIYAENTTCAAGGSVNAHTVAYASGGVASGAMLTATGVGAWNLAGLPVWAGSVGPGVYPYFIHTQFGAAENSGSGYMWRQSLGGIGSQWVITGRQPSNYFQYINGVPIINPYAALLPDTGSCFSCVTSMMHSFISGWTGWK